MQRSDDDLRQLIQNMSYHKGLRPETLKNKPIEEILETISIYHQELEFQNRELLRAQEATTRSEKRFSELFYDAPVGYVLINQDRKIVDLNRSFSELTGMDPKDLRQKQITDFIHPEYQDQFYMFLYRIFREAKSNASGRSRSVSRSLDVRLAGNLGQPFVVLSASPSELSDDLSEPVYKITVTNIDAQKRKEHALSVSEYKFRTLVRNAPVSFIISDGNDDIIFVNECFKELTGYQEKDLPGMDAFWSRITMLQTSEKDFVQNWEMLKNRATQNDRHTPSCLCRFAASGGDVLYFNLSAISVGGLFILSMIDLSQNYKLEQSLKKANDELQALNKDRLRILSIIGHDLRTPISIIDGASDMMKDDIRDGNLNSALEFTEIIQTTVKKAENLLLNLVEWAKMQSGTMILNCQKVNLVNLITDTIDLFRETARQKGIDIHTTAPEALIIEGDLNYLQTLFRNLISNAVKFSHPGNEIKLRLDGHQKPGVVTFQVQDFGIGIDQQYLGSIFRPDNRYNRSGTSGEQSTGLGLILCMEIVTRHGGDLRVSSEVGKGSLFTVELPFICQTEQNE